MPPLRCLLIANRGEIVSRVARTARRMGLRTVAVYTTSDAAGPWLRDVDAALALGDDATSSPYLDIETVVGAALRAGADAVHPGYGFLAENADLAAACVAACLTWVGPPPEVIRAMGLKVEAKASARAAGVPVLESVEVGDDIAAAVAAAASLPLPLLVKPSAGGGGRGMRRVDERHELPAALQAARREAISSFGDGTLFVERCIEGARHVEVQLLGDHHGAVLHLGERDCSLQRRHQKIVEEAPAPALEHRTRILLTESAVALARAIGYRSVGTAEFLVYGDEIAFLELNTRLQVEHGVTEEVTGLDLVELQLRIAAGEPLSMAQSDVAFSGHAIEARLYAEDPGRGFLPSPGMVERFDLPSVAGVRWETGVAAGTRVGSRYDPMIAKAIAHGPDREAAIGRLTSALGSLRVHGIRTNRDLLLRLLAGEELRRGEATTDLLARRPDLLTITADPALTRFHAVAAALGGTLALGERQVVHGFAPPGWRNLRSQDAAVRYQGEHGATVEVRHRAERDGSWTVTADDERSRARVRVDADGWIELELDGLWRRCLVCDYGVDIAVDSADGHSRFQAVDDAESSADAGSAADAVAPLPGVVVAVAVGVGDSVETGTPLVVMEAMKMEHQIVAVGAGVVERVAVSPGESVDYQQLLVAIGESRGQ
jgi:propionyl-CoA carboxylase alpha chain